MQSLGNIGIIGGGNMGSCLIGGLIKKGYPKENLFVADHGLEKCQALTEKWGIESTTNNLNLISKIDMLVLAVKPQSLKKVLEDLGADFDANKLIVSVAAGITTLQIQRWLGLPRANVIRAMPNTPALLGYGISGLFAPPTLSALYREQAQALLSSVGETLWVEDETLLDVVTALSGSGPAYFFYFMESLIQGANQLGLTEDAARKLTFHTALGSAQMALNTLNTKEDISLLRQQVTSKGGTTEKGINVLKDGKLPTLIAEALKAATARGKSLSQQYD
jgi:pyrroline-5-carboxylate reductase